MLQRALVNEGVHERQQQLFRAAGVRHYRQLLQRSSWDVAHAVDLSVHEVEELLDKVSVRLAPQSRSAFDMFLESANHPVVLRTGLSALDHALCGGLHHSSIVEVAGVTGIGKSQFALTLSVLCALEHLTATVIYIDTAHNFSAKRVFQIAWTRVRLRNVHTNVDLEAAAASIVQRIRVVRVDSLAKFLTQLRELEATFATLNVKLLVIDSVTRLFADSNAQTHAQQQHQMLRLARDLKLLADTHDAFVFVTNAADVAASPMGLFTQPLLGDTWSHCVTTRLIMERHPQQRVVSIVKSPVAGYVVQPVTIDETGVVSVVDVGQQRDFELDDDDDDAIDPNKNELDDDGDDDALWANVALQIVEPSCTLRSTQRSSAEENDDESGDANDDRCAHAAAVNDAEDGGRFIAGHDVDVDDALASRRSSQSDMFDLVSDSNDSNDDDDSDG